MSKNSKRYQLWMGLMFALIAILLIVLAVINAMNGEGTGNVTIGEETKVTGVVCKDTALTHPALMSKPMMDHINTITANFRDDKLSSISLIVEGSYENENMAKEGMYFAQADYNLTLTNKYGEKDDIFSTSFSINGPKMQMTQTAPDINKINGNTVTYFLLNQGTSIAKTLEGLMKQYEAKGFLCEKLN